MPQEFPRSLPAEQGVAADSIGHFLDAIAAQSLELHSVMLVRHGHVVAEGWWHPHTAQQPHMLFSLSKSFTSTAIGFAVQEGRLSVDDTMISFFPNDITPKMRENLGAVKIRHLLSMSTGHAGDTMDGLHRAADGNWVRAFLQQPITYEPGTHFLYNTGATYMLSAILQSVTGETLLDYLTPRLFDPLGIVGATWETCPRGMNTGGFGLSIKTEDIAKFGQFLLHRGVWRGQELLSAGWVDEATMFHVANGSNPDSDWTQGYGYQFWRCRHNAYRGDGAFGQYCVVLPEQDAVVAITSGLNDMQAVLDAVWNHLLPGLADGSETNTVASESAALATRLHALAISVPAATAALQSVPWTGVWFDYDDNPWHVRSLKIDFAEAGFELIVALDDEVETLVGRYGGWVYGETKRLVPVRGQHAVAVHGAWTSNDSFAITLCYHQSPYKLTLHNTFTETGVETKIVQNVAFGPVPSHLLVGTTR